MKAMVKDIEVGTSVNCIAFVGPMRIDVGKVFEFMPANSTVNWFFKKEDSGFLFHSSWLEPVVTAIVRNVPENTILRGILFISDMLPLIGKTFRFVRTDYPQNAYCFAPGEGNPNWTFLGEWLDIQDEDSASPKPPKIVLARVKCIDVGDHVENVSVNHKMKMMAGGVLGFEKIDKYGSWWRSPCGLVFSSAWLDFDYDKKVVRKVAVDLVGEVLLVTDYDGRNMFEISSDGVKKLNVIS